jgi:dTMP kinase
MNTMNKLFITLEGIEGAGKSTQAKLLNDALKQKGVASVLTREPGGVETAEAIREILLHKDIDPISELLLYEAARTEHFCKIIRPALDSGKTVVCDRFIDASIAYQGYGRGIDIKMVEELNKIATFGVKPDLTFVVDIPAEMAFERLKQRGLAPDRFERLDVEFYKRVRKGYLDLNIKEPKRVVVVDGTKSVEEVHKAIMEKIK